jgi:dTDP-glucose pyrophosphorylase
MNILIPMAGDGARFKQSNKNVIKPLIDIRGKPMAIRAIETLGLEGRLIVVLRKNEDGNTIYKVLKTYLNNFEVVWVEELTQGPACSALLAKSYIDNTEPLIITNCDQIMTWDPHGFSNYIKNINYDGIIVTYFCDKNKNSYAKCRADGLVDLILEKVVLSDISLNGIHYWKHGKDFVWSVEEMVSKNGRSVNGEFYISQTYNYLIDKGCKVGIYHIPNSWHHAVGIPEDLENFLNNENIQFK